MYVSKPMCNIELKAVKKIGMTMGLTKTYIVCYLQLE